MPETTLHITHWKAGSTWIRRILRQVEPDRFARPEQGFAPFADPPPEGSIFSCYATREQVEEAGLQDAPRFIVIRDLRDTLVSAYFSFRDTHVERRGGNALRDQLLELDKEDGLILLMDGFLPRCAAIQRSWAGAPVIHYEDLLTDDLAILGRTFAEIGLAVPDVELERAVKASRFRRQTGRRRGDEAADHLRKGVAGDWRNHFTDRVATEFERRFG